MEEGSRCAAASFEIWTSIWPRNQQRLAILGKLAKLDPSGRSTGKLRDIAPAQVRVALPKNCGNGERADPASA